MDKNLVAGFLSSTFTTLLLHPLDVLRINQIANNTKLMPTARDIVRNCTMYRALPISLLAYVTSYSIYFPLNDYLKRHTPWQGDINKYAMFTFATIPPSFIGMTICNPLWTIKAHQINTAGATPPDNQPTHGSLIRSMRSIYETSGYRGFYKGLLFGYVNSMNGIISFALYDIFKDAASVDTSLGYLWCSLASKTIATVVCFPIFAMRIRQQVDQMSLCETLTSLTRRPLYSGIVATLAQQLPKHSILLVMFEAIKKIL